MPFRIRATKVATALDAAGHEASERDPDTGDWDYGYRCIQDGPRSVVLIHDGPGLPDGLIAYTGILRAAGYHVVPNRPQGQHRVRLLVTRP